MCIFNITWNWVIILIIVKIINKWGFFFLRIIRFIFIQNLIEKVFKCMQSKIIIRSGSFSNRFFVFHWYSIIRYFFFGFHVILKRHFKRLIAFEKILNSCFHFKFEFFLILKDIFKIIIFNWINLIHI